ncbi:MFS transporter [Ancylobacter pratisalsi]|uniref:MFS transporter n=1 Tax=Ancylobacter pratisalsi TaxID=1745854 RepID=UPI001AEE0B02|nr:MFS transporter [Ancylobacter pratisalsi]
MTSTTTSPAQPCARPTRRRTLALSGLAHALHDGYTDAIYVLLPVWRAEFGLDYVALALLRGLYAGAMAALQVPASWLADHVGGRAVLILGTVLAAAGYALAGFSGGAMGLYAALLVSGAGSSVQHPIASSAVSRAYGPAARGPLGTYNFTGDLGKAIIPAALSLGLSIAPWRSSLWLLALAGIVVAALLTLFMPRIDPAPPPSASLPRTSRRGGRGFPLLLSIGVVDTGVRMGFLTFLPFLLQLKGASQPLIGTALALVFLGGAAGKLACGWLAQRWGIVGVTLCTEGATALMIAFAAVLPLAPLLVLLPLLGLALNGTSSVLYGTVPELAPADRTERAFAIFYTGVIGSGALSPLLFGVVGDQAGPVVATLGTAAAALITLPLALALGPRLTRR